MNSWNTTTLNGGNTFGSRLDLATLLHDHYRLKRWLLIGEDSKYLKFYVGKTLLKFVVLPNGLSSGLQSSLNHPLHV